MTRNTLFRTALLPFFLMPVFAYPQASTPTPNCCEGLSSITGGFIEPTGLAIDYGRNLIYISDPNTHSFFVFTTGGSPVTNLVSWPGGGFNTPMDVALDNQGNVFVPDYNGQTVYEFNATTFSNMAAIGVSAVGLPRGVWLDTQGVTTSLYITSQNDNVYRYDSISGGPFNAAATFGGSSVLNVPTEIMLQGNTIYVVDDGKHLVEFSVPGYIPTTLYTGSSDLKGIRTDLAGNFYATEGNGCKLDMFLSGLANAPIQCSIPTNPWGVVLDSAGKIYVCEQNGDSVTVLQGCVVETTLTPVLTPTSTNTLAPTLTPTVTQTTTPTPMPAETYTPTMSFTPTDTKTPTPTRTPTYSPTITDTFTGTNTPTPTPTETYTPTITNTFTVTNTPTIIPTPTSTATPTATGTPCGYPGNTCTPTPTPLCTDIFYLSKNVFNPSGPVSIFAGNSIYPGPFSLNIYNSAGEHIKTLDSQYLEAPFSQSYQWDGTNKYGNPCASGVYLIYLSDPHSSKLKRIILVK